MSCDTHDLDCSLYHSAKWKYQPWQVTWTVHFCLWRSLKVQPVGEGKQLSGHYRTKKEGSSMKTQTGRSSSVKMGQFCMSLVVVVTWIYSFNKCYHKYMQRYWYISICINCDFYIVSDSMVPINILASTLHYYRVTLGSWIVSVWKLNLLFLQLTVTL